MSSQKNILGNLDFGQVKIGFDWGDLGKNIFGGVHVAGRVLATLFGGAAGAKLADTSESLESKGHLLPDWARSNTAPGQDEPVKTEAAPPPPAPAPLPPAQRWTVVKCDAIVVTIKGQKNPKMLKMPTTVAGEGGTIFPGNGYKKGDDPTEKHSFRIDGAQNVTVSYAGKGQSLTNVQSIKFCGGQEFPQAIQGDVMANDDDNKTSYALIGAYVLGAASPSTARGRVNAAKQGRTQFTMRRSPIKGRPFTAAVTPNVKKTDKVSIANAQMAAKRAEQVAKKLDKLIAKTKQTKIHGLTPNGKARSGHPRLSLAQIKKIAKDLHVTGKKTGDQAVKHAAVVDVHNKRVMAGVQLVRSKLGPSGVKGQSIRGDENDWTEILGAQICALDDVFQTLTGDDPPPIPDPTNPGYMTDGSIDPNAGGAPAPTDDGSAAAPSLPGPPDYGLGDAPTMESIDLKPNTDYTPDPHPDGVDAQRYQCASVDPGDPASGLPLGAVIYDWQSQPMVISGVGSLNRFAPGAASSNPAGDGSSGFEWGNWTDNGYSDGWYLFFESAYNDGISIDLRYKHEGQDANTFSNDKDRQAESIRQGWGPLIGNMTGTNPNVKGRTATGKHGVSAWVKGLRYDETGDRWFWYYDMAPDSLKQPLKLKLLSQAQTDYNAALAEAKSNYAAQVAQDMADAKAAADTAKQQAAEDSAALHTANLQALDQQRQQGELNIQQQQADIDSQKQEDLDTAAANKQMLEYYQNLPATPAADVADARDAGGISDGGDLDGRWDSGEDGVDWGDGDDRDSLEEPDLSDASVSDLVDDQ